jgi:hypothetical protein
MTFSVRVSRKADEMIQLPTDQLDARDLPGPSFAPRVELGLPQNAMGKLILISVLERVFSVLQGKEPVMKKLLLAFLTVAVLAATVPSTVAQDGIVLGASLTNSIQFLGTGSGGFLINFNQKFGTRGKAFGQGPDLGGPNSCGSGTPCVGTYKLIQSSPIQTTLTTPGCNSTCNWSISMANNALLFDFGPGPGGNNNHGQWLSGNVQFENFTQTRIGVNIFHDAMVADLTNLGGILAQYFPSGGALLDLKLSFTTGQDLSQLALGRFATDGIGSGDVTQTPEPGTMALLGSGILLLGQYLRKRRNV